MSHRRAADGDHAPPRRQDGRMLIVRATKKLLDRIGPPTLDEGEQSTTMLG
jgi:hypothetical protein